MSTFKKYLSLAVTGAFFLSNFIAASNAESIISGVTPQFVTNAASTGITSLSVTNGTYTLLPVEYGNPTLVATGNLTGNVVYLLPNNGTWVVWNNTTANGFLVSFKPINGNSGFAVNDLDWASIVGTGNVIKGVPTQVPNLDMQTYTASNSLTQDPSISAVSSQTTTVVSTTAGAVSDIVNSFHSIQVGGTATTGAGSHFVGLRGAANDQNSGQLVRTDGIECASQNGAGGILTTANCMVAFFEGNNGSIGDYVGYDVNFAQNSSSIGVWTNFRCPSLSGLNAAGGTVGNYYCLNNLDPSSVIATLGQVVIGASFGNGDAALEVDSTTQGFLPPRMTTTQRTALTFIPEGLIVYDTTLHSLYNYVSSTWEPVGPSNPQITECLTTCTFTAAPTTQMIHLIMWGQGGCAGSGARENLGTVGTGGAGGGGGLRIEKWIKSVDLTYPVTFTFGTPCTSAGTTSSVGAGGTPSLAGANVTLNTTPNVVAYGGGSGSGGGTATVSAGGGGAGGGGAGGNASGGTPGAAGANISSMDQGTIGGTGANSTNVGFASMLGAASGAGASVAVGAKGGTALYCVGGSSGGTLLAATASPGIIGATPGSSLFLGGAAGTSGTVGGQGGPAVSVSPSINGGPGAGSGGAATAGAGGAGGSSGSVPCIGGAGGGSGTTSGGAGAVGGIPLVHIEEYS